MILLLQQHNLRGIQKQLTPSLAELSTLKTHFFLEVVETKNDDQGRNLTLSIKICDNELLLVNFYNAKLKKSKQFTLTKLSEMLNCILNFIDKNATLGGDFNLFFDI